MRRWLERLRMGRLRRLRLRRGLGLGLGWRLLLVVGRLRPLLDWSALRLRRQAKVVMPEFDQVRPGRGSCLQCFAGDARFQRAKSR
jgi:hypothetical protein